MTAIIDSGVWIAAFNKKNINHIIGKRIAEAIDDGKIQDAFITDYIFNEVVTYCRKKIGFDKSKEIAEKLLNSFDIQIIYTDKATFNASYHIFQIYPNLSFTDASLVVIMENNNIPYIYSFDSGFDVVKVIHRLENFTEIY